MLCQDLILAVRACVDVAHLAEYPYSELWIWSAKDFTDHEMELVDAPERALSALHITKSTPHHRNHLRVHPRGDAYTRLIDPNGVIDPGQRPPGS